MSLPASGDLPNYPSFANARLYDAEFDRMVAQCMAYGEGIAPFDQTKDCTITAMGNNKATDLEVTTNSSGLQLSVALGNAWVQGDSRTTQGLYFCHVPAATTVTTTAANGTHPRIDAIVLQVNDADADGGGATNWEIVCEAGTATSGATLSNLTGAPTIPDSALLLAYVLVPATFAGPFVNATHILDMRHFAYRPGRVLGTIDYASSVNTGSIADGVDSGNVLGSALTICGDGSNIIDVSVETGNCVQSATSAWLADLRLWDGAIGGSLLAYKLAHGTVANARVTGFRWDAEVPAFSGQKSLNYALRNATGSNVTLVINASATSPIRLVARYR